MNIKRNIIFSLESRQKNGIPIVENIPIRMRVIYAGNRIEFTTGYRIDMAKWDDKAQRVKNGCTNKLKQTASEINTDLNEYSSTIQNIFKEFEVLEIVPNPIEIKDAFNRKYKKNQDREEPKENTSTITFFSAFDEFVKECGTQNNWTESTYKKFKTVKNHLMTFDENITFESLDEPRLTEYVNYLRNKKDFRNSSIEKQLKFVKWFLRWSIRKGYNDNTAFNTFKPKLKTTQKKVIFLTAEELTKLWVYSVPETKKYLDRVRDIFLFCCFTNLEDKKKRKAKEGNWLIVRNERPLLALSA